MAATWIADTLRGAGLTVVEHDGWRTRSNGAFTPSAVVWHHDASPPGDSPGVPAYMIRNFRNAGAQLWVSRAGVWHVIAAGQAYHAGKVLPGKPGNRDSWGIETDMTTGESWSPALLESLRRGTAAILARMNRGVDRLEFHKTICSPRGRKVDPYGLDLATERADVGAILNRRTAVAGATNPTPTVPEDDMTPDQERLLVAIHDLLTPGKEGVKFIGDLYSRVEAARVASERAAANTAPIRRGGKDVSLRQEVADAHTFARRAAAELEGQRIAIDALAKAQGFDPEMVRETVRAGVASALASIETTVTIKEQS